jgi:hypothetical protein
MSERIRHQLNIHLDYRGPERTPFEVEVRFSYPHAGDHSLPETSRRWSSSSMSPRIEAAFRTLYSAMESRIPAVEKPRLPHASLTVRYLPQILTFVVQDQSRSSQLPLARLYYIEVLPVRTQIEKEVCVGRSDWSADELSTCEVVRQAVKSFAWSAYKSIVGEDLHQ